MALDWFTWQGESSRDYGIRVLQQPPIAIAQERVKYETVAGRPSSLTILQGVDVYDDVQLPFECVMDDMTQLARAAAWLQGEGALAFPGRPGGWYAGARISQQISMDKVMAARAHRQFTLNFRAGPFFYLDGAADIEISGADAGSAAGYGIDNPGTVASAPRIEIHGSGSFGLAINGQAVTLRGVEDGIVLDAELQDALSLDGSILLNDRMTGEFPTIAPGHSTVWWYADETGETGSVSLIVITPRWRIL